MINRLKHELTQPGHGLSAGGGLDNLPFSLAGLNHISRQRVDPPAVVKPQHLGDIQGDVQRINDPPSHGIVDVVIDVGNLIRHPDNLSLQGLGPVRARVAENAPAHLIAEIQPLAPFFQAVHHPKGLLVVPEATGKNLVEHPLPRVAKGGVPQVVTQGNGLGEVLVEPQAPGDGAGDPNHLQGVGHSGAVVVPLRLEEHLGLMHQTPKGLGVENPVNIPLIAGSDLTGFHGALPPPRVRRQRRIGGQGLSFQFFCHLPQEHGHSLPFRVVRACSS